MYHSELYQKGYSIIYKNDNDHISSYFCVDTQQKNIILINTRQDIKTIESLLHSADMQYKGLDDISET